MYNITFVVETQSNYPSTLLTNELKKFNLRYKLELEKGFITFDEVEENLIITIIKLVEKYYQVLCVEIDN